MRIEEDQFEAVEVEADRGEVVAEEAEVDSEVGGTEAAEDEVVEEVSRRFNLRDRGYHGILWKAFATQADLMAWKQQIVCSTCRSLL